MSEISALPSSIVEWLEGREDLDYIKFLTEFPPIKKAVPRNSFGIRGTAVKNTRTAAKTAMFTGAMNAWDAILRFFRKTSRLLCRLPPTGTGITKFPPAHRSISA